MARIPRWFAVAVIGAALLPGVRAEAQTDWVAQTTAKAVAVCAAGSTDPQAIIRDAKAAGWSDFEQHTVTDSGLDMWGGFNTKPPLSNNSPFVGLQVGHKTATYPGGVRLRQVACNVVPPISHAALLERQLAARFPNFSVASSPWVASRKAGQAMTPLEGGVPELQRRMGDLAPGDSLILVEFNTSDRAAIGTVRIYQRSP